MRVVSDDEVRARLMGYARALLDTCDDFDFLMPDSPYSMSSNQLKIDICLTVIRREASQMISILKETDTQ